MGERGEGEGGGDKDIRTERARLIERQIDTKSSRVKLVLKIANFLIKGVQKEKNKETKIDGQEIPF